MMELGPRGGEALRSEIQDGFHLFAGEAVEEVHDFVDGETILEVLKYGGDGHARAAENLSSAELARDAFDGRAL
jgi:hypothetical protein